MQYQCAKESQRKQNSGRLHVKITYKLLHSSEGHVQDLTQTETFLFYWIREEIKEIESDRG